MGPESEASLLASVSVHTTHERKVESDVQGVNTVWKVVQSAVKLHSSVLSNSVGLRSV